MVFDILSVSIVNQNLHEFEAFRLFFLNEIDSHFRRLSCNGKIAMIFEGIIEFHAGTVTSDLQISPRIDVISCWNASLCLFFSTNREPLSAPLSNVPNFQVFKAVVLWSVLVLEKPIYKAIN